MFEATFKSLKTSFQFILNLFYRDGVIVLINTFKFVFAVSLFRNVKDKMLWERETPLVWLAALVANCTIEEL